MRQCPSAPCQGSNPAARGRIHGEPRAAPSQHCGCPSSAFTPIIVGFVRERFITAGITVDDGLESLLTLAINGALTGVYYVAVRLLQTYVAPSSVGCAGLVKTPTPYTAGSPARITTPSGTKQPAAGTPPGL
jgi:hypothetical protein